MKLPRVIALGAVFTAMLLLGLAAHRPASAINWWPCVPAVASATPTPIAQQQLNDGATLALRMNDAAAPCTSIADGSASPHNATVFGGVTCGVAGGGKDGATAISFNGTTGRLTDAAPTYAYPFTIEFAINYSTINSGGIWDMNPGVGGTRDNLCNVSTVNSANAADIGVAATCYSSFSTGQWIFIDVIYATSQQSVYLNGTLSSQGAAASGTYAQGATIGIGALNGNTVFFAGSLQDFAIYPSALSAATIQKHAAAYFAS